MSSHYRPYACRKNRRAAAPDAVHEVRVRWLSALRGSHRCRQGRDQPLPARWRGRDCQARRVSRAPAAATESGQWLGAAAAPRGHRRIPLHRLHAVHPGVPGRCDRRRAPAHAQRHRRVVQWLRPVRRALPMDCVAMVPVPGRRASGPKPMPATHAPAIRLVGADSRTNAMRASSNCSAKAHAKLDELQERHDLAPADLSRKQAVVRAAIERARARRGRRSHEPHEAPGHLRTAAQPESAPPDRARVRNAVPAAGGRRSFRTGH